MIKGWIGELGTMVFKEGQLLNEHIQIMLGEILFKEQSMIQ
jgi:hypothetical protein